VRLSREILVSVSLPKLPRGIGEENEIALLDNSDMSKAPGQAGLLRRPGRRDRHHERIFFFVSS